jgi:hypothetical protein
VIAFFTVQCVNLCRRIKRYFSDAVGMYPD